MSRRRNKPWLVWDARLFLHSDPTRRPPRFRHRGDPATAVYLLIDPRDGTARYVGVTSDPDRRLVEHMLGEQDNIAMRKWVRSLKACGLALKMAVVGRTTGQGWVMAERSWIRWLRRHGGCYNILAGGPSLPKGGAGSKNPFHNGGRTGSARRKFDRIAGKAPARPTTAIKRRRPPSVALYESVCASRPSKPPRPLRLDQD